MNATQEVREQYKQAARACIHHLATKDLPMSKNFYQGRMSGLDIALSCLGVTSDEIREMYNACEEEVKDERAQEDIGPGDVNYDEEGFVIAQKDKLHADRRAVELATRQSQDFGPRTQAEEVVTEQEELMESVLTRLEENIDDDLLENQEFEELDAAKRPISPEEYTAYCDEYGKAFNSKDAVKIPYNEYPGASVSYEDVSPCCGTGFSDRPKEEDDIYECEHCNAEFKASEILYHKYGGEIGTIAFCPRCFQATKLICVTDLAEARK